MFDEWAVGKLGFEQLGCRTTGKSTFTTTYLLDNWADPKIVRLECSTKDFGKKIYYWLQILSYCHILKFTSLRKLEVHKAISRHEGEKKSEYGENKVFVSQFL